MTTTEDTRTPVTTDKYTIGCLFIPDTKGDTRIMWDSRNPDEVAAAKKQFDELTKKGFWAYKVEGKEGTQGEKITTFDPKAERIILAKQTAGG